MTARIRRDLAPARPTRRAALAGVAGLAALALASCGSSEKKPADAGEKKEEKKGGADQGLKITDPWVKAADSGMTAAFMTIHNPGPSELALKAAQCDFAGVVELHEVSGGTMHKTKGDLPIPAGGDLVLKPGGYHIMFMDLKKPLKAGDNADFTLEFADGSTQKVSAVIKDYAGAKENYGDGHGASDGGGEHKGHDHGDHKGHDHEDHEGH